MTDAPTTATGYIYDPVETDEDVLQQEAFDFIQSVWPDWEPDDSNLEAWLIAACARMVAEARAVGSDVPAAIFRFYGSSILGIPPVDATPSSIASTWAFTDNPAGRTIEAGTLALVTSDADAYIFEVLNDVTVAAGTLTTAVGEVILRSQDEGAETAGLGGPGVVVDLVDPIAWVQTVTLEEISAGGGDGETDEAYLDRLSRRLTLLAARPILADDFAVLAEDIAAQNGDLIMAMSIDNYNPADGTTNNEKMVTVVLRDQATGADVTSAIKTLVDNGLQAMREANFVVNVVDPDGPHTVDITFAGVALPGYDPIAVQADAISALQAFFATETWGIDPQSESRRWRNVTVVRFQDASTVLNNVQGFDHWTTLTIGINGGAQGSTDVTLPGIAPLAAPGNIVGAVTG